MYHLINDQFIAIHQDYIHHIFNSTQSKIIWKLIDHVPIDSKYVGIFNYSNFPEVPSQWHSFETIEGHPVISSLNIP